MIGSYAWGFSTFWIRFGNRIRLDLFMSCYNTQLLKYFTWTLDPEVINAFHQNWSEMNLWINPLRVLISKIIFKLIREKETATLLVPWWETASWFPLSLKVLIEP